MITVEKIRALAQEKLAEGDNYIVDISIKPGNKITVLLDNFKGVSIKDCVEMSRQIEFNLDRETEDFELNVSSPGIDKPFKVLKQYIKNIGKQVEVLTKENKKLIGTLLSANENEVELEIKEKGKNANNKQQITNNYKLNHNQIKETKIVISF
jgi:ribosome maturation factor RimP